MTLQASFYCTLFEVLFVFFFLFLGVGCILRQQRLYSPPTRTSRLLKEYYLSCFWETCMVFIRITFCTIFGKRLSHPIHLSDPFRQAFLVFLDGIFYFTQGDFFPKMSSLVFIEIPSSLLQENSLAGFFLILRESFLFFY